MVRSDLSPLPVVGSAKLRGGDNRAEPDAIAPPGRLSAAMPKGPKRSRTCERGSGQGPVGSKASGACRGRSFPLARPAAGSQVRAGPRNA